MNITDYKIKPQTELKPVSEKILQFGEGNFLRAFVGWMINKMESKGIFSGKIIVVQPLAKGRIKDLNDQKGLYTVLLRGISQGEVVQQKELITSVSRGIDPYCQWEEFLKCAEISDLRFIVSNTTEAGIVYEEESFPSGKCPLSFPAKVAAFLYRRYMYFKEKGTSNKGFVFLPCELIDRNGEKLKECVLKHVNNWNLEESFTKWIEDSSVFLNTLVDRIVPGYPREEINTLFRELGYHDKLLTTGEIYHLWVIEGDKKISLELPFEKAGLNVVWTDNLQEYRTRKVRILNGAHTMTVPMAYLLGKDTVLEAVSDQSIMGYMRKGLFEEILPTLSLSEEEVSTYALSVIERFKNPFMKHYLLDISLNSISKFKVRVLPSLLEFVRIKGELPQVLTFSLAALIAFYRGTEVSDGVLKGCRNSQDYSISDSPGVLLFFVEIWKAFEVKHEMEPLVETVLSNISFWGMDLNSISGLQNAVTRYLYAILFEGIDCALKEIS